MCLETGRAPRQALADSLMRIPALPSSASLWPSSLRLPFVVVHTLLQASWAPAHGSPRHLLGSPRASCGMGWDSFGAHTAAPEGTESDMTLAESLTQGLQVEQGA